MLNFILGGITVYLVSCLIAFVLSCFDIMGTDDFGDIYFNIPCVILYNIYCLIMICFRTEIWYLISKGLNPFRLKIKDVLAFSDKEKQEFLNAINSKKRKKEWENIFEKCIDK